MEPFTLHILGCGSALPTTRHWPSCQVLRLKGRVYVIDCGEGCQVLLRRSRICFSRIMAVFISHMHGDHILGLPGLLSTFALQKRTTDLKIYGPKGIKSYIKEIASRFLESCSYNIEVFEHSSCESVGIHADNCLRVSTIPLSHKIPTTGYRFEEICVERHLLKSVVDSYDVPISFYKKILAGEGYTTNEGKKIPNEVLTRKGDPPRVYAYCSDTSFYPPVVESIKGIDLLYHEATYCEKDKDLAKERFHSTGKEAALIAREANVKKLMLGHYSSRYSDDEQILKEAQDVFPETILSYEGLVLNL